MRTSRARSGALPALAIASRVCRITRPAQAMHASLRRHGLDAPSMHASYDRLRGEFDSVLEEARILGGTYLVCPSVDAGERKTAEDWKKFARH